MVLTCQECGYSVVLFIGEAAAYFSYCNVWTCPDCGTETVFPKQECLEFATYIWRN